MTVLRSCTRACAKPWPKGQPPAHHAHGPPVGLALVAFDGQLHLLPPAFEVVQEIPPAVFLWF